ncbi:hypothetical protein M9H77_12474 [Catharanthus roseus]|uniref:Uncharacterized protein n=1 Tax=Catharanthus roseus TaxID=4058 RepID=A0ACC0BHG1_CATRO|nr:hypothetical protein M9H77_12474 [Catharanthus roseus]
MAIEETMKEGLKLKNEGLKMMETLLRFLSFEIFSLNFISGLIIPWIDFIEHLDWEDPRIHITNLPPMVGSRVNFASWNRSLSWMVGLDLLPAVRSIHSCGSGNFPRNLPTRILATLQQHSSEDSDSMNFEIDLTFHRPSSGVKGVRIILDRVRIVSVLGIKDEGNTVTVDSDKKSIQEDPDWSYEVTYNRLRIRQYLGDRRCILHGGDFSQLLP